MPGEGVLGLNLVDCIEKYSEVKESLHCDIIINLK